MSPQRPVGVKRLVVDLTQPGKQGRDAGNNMDLMGFQQVQLDSMEYTFWLFNIANWKTTMFNRQISLNHP